MPTWLTSGLSNPFRPHARRGTTGTTGSVYADSCEPIPLAARTTFNNSSKARYRSKTSAALTTTANSSALRQSNNRSGLLHAHPTHQGNNDGLRSPPTRDNLLHGGALAARIRFPSSLTEHASHTTPVHSSATSSVQQGEQAIYHRPRSYTDPSGSRGRFRQLASKRMRPPLPVNEALPAAVDHMVFTDPGALVNTFREDKKHNTRAAMYPAKDGALNHLQDISMWWFLRVTDRCDCKLERKQERNSADAELLMRFFSASSWILLSAKRMAPLVNYFVGYVHDSKVQP
jgi:hypothetical protein